MDKGPLDTSNLKDNLLHGVTYDVLCHDFVCRSGSQVPSQVKSLLVKCKGVCPGLDVLV